MRPNRNSAMVLLLLIYAAGSTVSAAQQAKPISPATAAKAVTIPQNLLPADDGLAVIAAALDARNRFSDKADCSHLVHDIYERAGFAYSYVPSTDLYTGIAEFRRVMHPQPGDLIVWPGHVGIVVSPTRHTFYSALRSGLGVEPYDSAYWKQRGRPRFLRYVKDSEVVQASSAKTPVLKTTSLETKPPLVPAETGDAEGTPASAVPLATATFQFPRTLTVKSPRPTAKEVSETVMNALSQTADGLKGKNIYNQPQTIVVLRRIEVEHVKIKGTAGWADVQTSEVASLANGQSILKKRQQKQRWTLYRRDEQSWELMVPPGTMFLNQDDAARLLAQQLAVMTAEDSSNDARQKAQLAALLGSLLQVKN